MTTEPTLSELLTRARLLDEAQRLVRQIQIKLDRVIKQHQREVYETSVRQKPRVRKA